jgi:hypothetical protein
MIYMAMEQHEIREASTGLFAVALHTVGLVDLARMLRQDVPYVYVESYAPFESLAWTEVRVPLSVASMPAAAARRVRRLRFDLLFTTSDFLAAIDELDQGSGGLRFWQLQQAPSERIWSLVDPKPHARRKVYEHVGVVLSFDLPHRNETCVVAALTRAELESALARL